MTPQPKPTVLSKVSAWAQAKSLALDELMSDFSNLAGSDPRNNTTAILALLDMASRVGMLAAGTEEASGDAARR